MVSFAFNTMIGRKHAQVSYFTPPNITRFLLHLLNEAELPYPPY